MEKKIYYAKGRIILWSEMLKLLQRIEVEAAWQEGKLEQVSSEQYRGFFSRFGIRTHQNSKKCHE